MALPIPPVNNNPIPNSPFYSSSSYAVLSPSSFYVLGSGLSVSADGVLSSGGGGSVSGVFSGAGINVSANTGNVTISNSGVTSLNAGSNIILSGTTGAVTISATGLGTVTSVTAGAGLNGGTITSAGTISLPNTGVTAGSYANPSLTVDAQGRISSISSGSALQSISGTFPLSITSGTNPTISVATGTTAIAGVVQLSDSVTSPSSATAATSLAIKSAYDAAISAIPKSCITAKGTLVTGIGASTAVALPVGTDGQVLTACSACTAGLTWATNGVTGTYTFGACTVTICNGIITSVA